MKLLIMQFSPAFVTLQRATCCFAVYIKYRKIIYTNMNMCTHAHTHSS